jgi:protein gp37
MSGPTGIEWTDVSWNPTSGCDKVSAGCDNCYALKQAARNKAMGSIRYQNDGDPSTSGPGFALTEHPDALNWPTTVKKPKLVFVNSMPDLFHASVTKGFIDAVFAVMGKANQHVYQILTKRPQRMASFFPADHVPLANVWLGTSIENQSYAWRANHLRATPAAVRFLSLEPLLGPVPNLDLTGIDWVIVGGESGPGARPMNPDWVREIRDMCLHAGVAFLFKQWGNWSPNRRDKKEGETFAFRLTVDEAGSEPMYFYGRKSEAGRTLDGVIWDQYPAQAKTLGLRD